MKQASLKNLGIIKSVTSITKKNVPDIHFIRETLDMHSV